MKNMSQSSSPFAILEKQQMDIVSGLCPVYQDSRIKQIPINESNEKLVDIKEMNHPLVQMLPDPNKPFDNPDCNAGFECSSFVRKSLFERLVALAENINKSRPGTIVKVFEGLRNIQTQDKLYDCLQKQIQETYPDLSSPEIQKLTEKYISKGDAVPRHCTGASVAVRLFDTASETFLDMGKFGYMWFKKLENNEANTYSANLSPEQKSNRALLLTCASMAGLINYPYEWWNFSFGDRYFCYYTNNPRAIYGSL